MTRKTSDIPLTNLGNSSDQDELVKPGGQPSLSRNFNRTLQAWTLFKEQAVRLGFTTILVVFVIATLQIYQNEDTVDHSNKITFNTIITVLNLALGLNFLEAFKDMAKVLRWRILANRKFSVRQTDLILGGESLLTLLKLMRESLKKPLILFVCVTWIALNLLAQASVAMIGLTYSMDGGRGSHGVTTSKGLVNASKVDCYYDAGACSTRPGAPAEVAQQQAHAYGEITRGGISCPYETDDDIQKSPQNCTYFNNWNAAEFALRFLDYNPNDLSRSYPLLTNRIIRAFPGQCYQYDIGKQTLEDGTDGQNEKIIYPISNETYSGILPIPRPNTAYDSTTYVYNGSLTPQNATLQACGPRCVYVYAYRAHGPVTNRTSEIFQCPITISEVSNVANASIQALPDDIARLAAASIALTGRYTNPNGPNIPPEEWQQYQLYPYGSYWETDRLSSQQIGSRMAEFAIGSLAAMVNLNPPIQFIGTLPTLGYQLNVQWPYVIALSACIVAVHFILVIATLLIATPVVVGADSNLVTARLLHDLVGRLNGKGSLLKGTEIAKAIEREGDGGKLVYGVRETEHGRKLELGEDVVVRKRLGGGMFPEGEYI